MNNSMIIIATVFLAFLIPSLYFVAKEFLFKKDKTAVAVKKEPINIAILIKVTVVLIFIALPAFFLSDASYSFYKPDESSVKLAFKHTGKRVVDCDEADFIKKEGDRYRKQLKSTKQVQMDIHQLTGCPRERHPVVVELYVDDKPLIKKAYAPTGLKKDMASYIYSEFLLTPGAHKFNVRMFDKGKMTEPDYTYEEIVQIKPQEVKVVRFDDKINGFVIE